MIHTYFFDLHERLEKYVWGTLIVLGTGFQKDCLHVSSQLLSLLLSKQKFEEQKLKTKSASSNPDETALSISNLP